MAWGRLKGQNVKLELGLGLTAVYGVGSYYMSAVLAFRLTFR